MIDTIGGTVVIVSDQQKAVEFYTQKLGFELKTDMFFGSSNSSNSSGIRWVEVAPKKSQSNEGEIEAAKKGIGTETGIWFYSDDIQSSYRELKKKGVDIAAPEKQEWGGIMSKFKDQDGNSYSLISLPPST
jgi:lactoylglutathione lyase